MILTIFAFIIAYFFAINIGVSFSGGNVTETIESDILPSSNITIKVVIIILTSATFSLFIANYIGIPLLTSEVTVGTIIGVDLS